MKGQVGQSSSLDAFQELSARENQRLFDVWERVTDGCRDLMALKFSDGVLVFNVDEDRDTIDVRYQDALPARSRGFTSVLASKPWSAHRGKPFGWGWVTTNQQGYQDGVLLSFDGLVPSVLLFVMASSLHVMVISETSSKKQAK